MSLEWTLLALRLLAVAALYAFLIVIIYVIWRDLQTAARAEPQSSEGLTPADESAAPAGRLRVVTGGDTPLQAGDAFTLHTHATLGRAPDNHIVLPDTYASAYHARLDRHDDEWWLTDLGSRNGTRLNDVPISKPVPLADGDVIGVGQVGLRLEIRDLKFEGNSDRADLSPTDVLSRGRTRGGITARGIKPSDDYLSVPQSPISPKGGRNQWNLLNSQSSAAAASTIWRR